MSRRDPSVLGHSRTRFQASLAVVAVCLAALSAAAQTGGTVTMDATVSAAIKLTSGGASTLANDDGGSVTSSAADTTISVSLNFGDIGPANNLAAGVFVCFTQPLLIRSAAERFSFKAELTAESFDDTDANAIHASDVGLGVTTLGESGDGANVDVSRASIATGFDADPCAAPTDPNGTPTYSKTLADVDATATTLISDSNAANGPVTTGGDFTASNNAVTTNLKLAIVPASFTEQSSFTFTLSLTVVSP